MAKVNKNLRCCYNDLTLTLLQFLSTMKFEDAASIPPYLTTAIVGLYAERSQKEAPQLLPPWIEGGRGKYNGEPIVIFGGASSVGQFSKCSLATIYREASLTTF